ncbi:DUF4429 domain-containing protein [Streptomyces sp. LP05-1]|uniref:DUF4429 domain-containing protein n=1 Tax=Streptomyces pyxinae TaxID=2970734 RepID=A0ABT2CK17_9ACTN|nr:DUF4429 domain-containing protein [Streptomyces sp. LP05-1]MCS0637765.1 DUF4429 domain-containing protein [Streptomyces sp. LP05-1]
MAEIIQQDGTWTFDGDVIRVVPGGDKSVSPLRRTLGEVAVPLRAVAGISLESGRKAARLRLRLREGADPLIQATGGRLEEASDPYRLTVARDRTGVAEYFVDEVRNALLLDEVEQGPTDSYLLPGPALPVTVGAGDGTVAFDGERIRLSWNWKTEESKASGGERTLSLAEVDAVEWLPATGLENGFLRFRTGGSSAGGGPAGGASAVVPAKYDPYAVELWGFRKDPLMALVAAAVVARLPHPNAPRPAALPSGPAAGAPGPATGRGGDDPDALLRRLRELGELHRSGVLTDEEFTLAKQAVLKRL